jgi:GR25 family glycosyltransferase involved in LPS biosynthesis
LLNIDGYFINLERSHERFSFLSKQIADRGLADVIKRFPAVDGRNEGPFDNVGDNTVWACRRSHEKIILEGDPDSATVIIEDDVELSDHLPNIINRPTMQHIVETYPHLDMFFLDCCPFYDYVPLLLRQAESNMARVDTEHGARHHEVTGLGFFNAQNIYAFCTAGYVVLPKGKATLRRLFAESPDIRYPIDILYRDWISSGKLKANITVPFLVTPTYMNESTISYQELDQSQLLPDRQIRLISAVRRLVFGGNPNLDFDQIEPLLSTVLKESAEFQFGMKIYQSLYNASPQLT